MKKKGFTLIELLAVIIILAIIALIATPIIMRVIERSKKGASERSAENYIHAVETGAMALRTEGTILDGTYGITSDGNLCPNNAASCNVADEIKIEMSGTKPSSGSVVISNGKVTSTGTSLTIEDYTVTINESGSASAIKGSGSTTTTRYYHWGSGSISEGLPKTNIDTDVSNIYTYDDRFYLGFDSTDSKTIDTAYVCFVVTKNDIKKEYCLKGGDGGSAFESNQGILDEAFPESCSLDPEDDYSCSADGLHVFATTSGYVEAFVDHKSDGAMYCYVFVDSTFSCS